MYGWRGRLGAIMPSNNTVLEPELYSVLPAGLSLHGARVVSRGQTTRERIFSMTETIPHAIEELQKKVGVFCYACMTTSLLKPVGWHQTLEAAAGGAPFLPAGETMVRALEHLRVRRIGVFSPYFDDVAALVPAWFSQFGIQVVHNANVPFTPEQVISRRCEDLYPEIAREFKGKPIEALAILATDLATFTVLEALETDLGMPVVSSNLALLWCMLGTLGVRDAAAPGTLFRGVGASRA